MASTANDQPVAGIEDVLSPLKTVTNTVLLTGGSGVATRQVPVKHLVPRDIVTAHYIIDIIDPP